MLHSAWEYFYRVDREMKRGKRHGPGRQRQVWFIMAFQAEGQLYRLEMAWDIQKMKNKEVN